MTVDPFEGLPAHMIESLPYTVEVTVERRIAITTVNGEQKIMLDAVPSTETHVVQLERGGRPLTMADRPARWFRGEADGWRPYVSNPAIPLEEIIEAEAEEIIE